MPRIRIADRWRISTPPTDLTVSQNGAGKAPGRLFYGAWRRRWRTSLGFLALSLFMAATCWPKLLADGAPGLTLAEARQSFFALLLLPVGLWLTYIDIKARPALILGRKRLVFKGLFRTRAIRWQRLGPFHLTEAGAIRARKLFTVRVPILESDGGEPTGRFFIIPDFFSASLPMILQHIGSRGTVPMRWADKPSREQLCGRVGPIPLWVSIALPIAFLLPYALSWLLPITPAIGGMPSKETLVAFGAADSSLIGLGQWSRLLVAPFLHADIMQLAANMVSAGLVARLSERLIGRDWTIALFLIGALCGSLAAFSVSSPGDIVVGGAGAASAIAACLAIVSFRFPAGRKRLGFQYRLTELALPILIPLSSDAAALHISYASHLGGIIFGCGIGALLLSSWRPMETMPRFSRAALIMAWIAGGLIVIGGGVTAFHYRGYALMGAAIPDAKLPQGAVVSPQEAQALIDAYPRDPRPHLYLSAIALKKNDKPAAEREARTALALLNAGSVVFSVPLRNTTEALLAGILFDEGKAAEAKALAAPLCALPVQQAPVAPIFNRLVQAKLCPAPPGIPHPAVQSGASVPPPVPQPAPQRHTKPKRVHTRAGVSGNRSL